jgi:hypothetical protein
MVVFVIPKRSKHVSAAVRIVERTSVAGSFPVLAATSRQHRHQFE